MHDDIEDQHHHKAHGEAVFAADGGEAQPLHGLGEVVDHLVARHHQGEAPEHVLHAQGGHEGVGQVQPGEHQSVDAADGAAGQDAHHHHQKAALHAGFVHGAHQAGAEHGVGAHGQIDACGDEAQQHAHGQKGVEGGLLENTHDIADAVEILVGQRQDHAHDDQGQNGAHLDTGAAFPLSHLNFLPTLLS